MAHSFITIIIPVPEQNLAGVQRAVSTLGNPFNPNAQAVFDAIGRIHFASLNALPASSGNGGYLLFELSCDGEPQEILKEIANRGDNALKEPFIQTGLYESNQELNTFLARYSKTIGQDGSSTLGLAFCGTPELTVAQIHQEHQLMNAITGTFRTLPRNSSALAMLKEIRQRILTGTHGNRFAWAKEAHWTPVLDTSISWTPSNKFRAGLAIGWKFLWPVAMLLVAAALIGWILGSWTVAIGAILAVLAIVGAGICLGLMTFFKMESTDVPDDLNPDPERMAEIQKRENHLAQNHLMLLTPLKPGWLRKSALRVVFYAVRQLAEKGQFRKGFLSDIGTIHFARWVLVEETGDLLFFSNFGGSWESYLEDFISKANEGLTGVWSNTRGFPRTKHLIKQGATDGDRFKRWARRHQFPTQAWYSAYGDLTTQNIRTNAMVRHGFATVATEEAAQQWFRYFGSASRSTTLLETQEAKVNSDPLPAPVLETKDVQGLMFGGYGRLEEAACLVFSLTDTVSEARSWLRELLPLISFGENPPSTEGTIIGLTATGIKKLGLSEDGLKTFPTTFLQGIAPSYRARLLGDIGKNAPEQWTWGSLDSEIDGVLLVYAKDVHALQAVLQRIRVVCGSRARERHTIELENLKEMDGKEPFGFADGISQPILKGTTRAGRTAESIHVVEPGEFVLGYRDQLGYFPPSPHVAASQDPANLLPLMPRTKEDSSQSNGTAVQRPKDLGRNGSFLVLRQLEQNVAAFNEFLHHAVDQVRSQSGETVTEEWVAAKLIGRWKDGSPLVEHPTKPGGAPVSPLSSKQDNAFQYYEKDAGGLRCPLGAHIRRTNPRDSFGGNLTAELEINKRHRILRRGRVYRPQGTHNPGLLFACLNADLERQFEFVQQSWMNNPRFHGLSAERDPIAAGNTNGAFTIPVEHCPVKLTGLADFVTVRGGGYFFMPGRRTLEYLSK